MAKYIVKRIFYIIFVFFIMSVLLFFLYNSIPGDPARAEVQELKGKVSPEAIEKAYKEARARYGLDDPLIVRYQKWMTRLLTLNLGYSQKYKADINKLIVPPIKTTVFINIFDIILTLAITIPLGIVMAVHKNSIFDRTVQALTIVGFSVPTFIVALVFIYLFAVKLRWFPVSGMNTPNFQGTPWAKFVDTVWHITLPIIIMIFGALAGMTRYVRAAMVDALSMDFIRTARAKGVKEKVVIYSHAWRNALLPVITLIISWVMSIFAGSLILESMFSLNGMGKFYIDALMAGDYNVALALQVFYILIGLVGNLITDLSYGLVDPRVRINE
ncbi:ABC transporter permease [Guggenheimella bovis]